MTPSPTQRPGMHLTPQQERALSQERHLSVTANAGSGKTRVLVERYLAIVLSGSASVREIVALTYTEKAASELRRKIAQAVTETLGQSRDPRLTARLESVRDELASAVIGTIHAFCARILREHPVEADVDAAFGVIDGLDQRSALEEAVRETFRRVLAHEPPHPQREEMVEAVRVLGRPFVVRCVKYLTERRGELERLDAGLYRRSDQEILRFWDEHLRLYCERALTMPSLVSDLALVMSAATGKKAPEVKEQYRRFCDARTTLDRAAAFAQMVDGMFTTKGELLVSFIGTRETGLSVGPETHRLSAFEKTVRPILPAVTGSGPDEHHRALLALTRTLLTVTRLAIRRYEERKTETGRLDFEDLQLKTRALLATDTVRDQLRKRYTFVMVDEYQDTNQLQYDILLPMLDGLNRGNLFIVGDPKQSIYSFRQANVEVFERTRLDIRNRSGLESDLVLEESFRPLRDCAAFVNLVFSRLMGTGGTAGAVVNDQQVRYEPLTRARQNPAPGRVEILVKEENEQQTPMPEGEMVARRILQLVRAGHTVYDASEQPRPVRYRDIGVLLRTRKNLPDLEQALIRANVPYVVSSGVGYFQTQDIFDFYNYLEFLLNPGNDVALAGVLRSPFFCVSDAELFEVAGDRAGGGLWDHLVLVAARGETPPSVRNAVEALRQDLRVALRYPVPELLAHIIQRTHYHSKIAATVRGAQAKANLEKLRHIARAYEGQGFTTLFDFVQRLRGLIDEEEREGQGTIENVGDAVQLMTVHAAKGLEFPVVVLPYLSRQLNYDKEPFLHDRLGIGFSVPDRGGEWTPVPLNAFLQARSRSRTEAEEQRIFYVACTRARDLLCLSVDLTRSVRSANCRDWLLDALSSKGTLSGTSLEFNSAINTLTVVDGHFVPSREEHALVVPLLRAPDLEAVPAQASRPAAESEAPRILADPISSEAKGEIFSASKIRTYVECPSRYYLRYILGFPAEGGPFARGEEDELRDRDLPAELRGRIVHAVVQRLAVQVPDHGRILQETRAAFAREAPIGLAESALFAESLSAIVQKLVGSPIWNEMLDGAKTKTEFTMSVTFGDDYLTGTLDRVFQEKSGVWTIVDYKTDAVAKEGLAAKADAYWPQLELYALLTSMYFGVSAVNAILLFADHADLPLRRSFDAGSLERIRSQIADVIRRIRLREFRPRTSPCPACPFAPRGCSGLFALEP